MKKKLYVLAVLGIILAGAISGTLAYYTAKATAHNVITSGAIDIELVETWDHDNNPETPAQPYPIVPVTGIMPGEEHSKIVHVHNVGENPAWVRVKVEIYAEDEAGEHLDTDVLTINYNTGNSSWVRGEDGYFYYTQALAPNTATATPLFEKVTMAEATGDDYQNAMIIIDVKAESIQYQNNTDFAKAWPRGVEIIPLEEK